MALTTDFFQSFFGSLTSAQASNLMAIIILLLVALLDLMALIVPSSYATAVLLPTLYKASPIISAPPIMVLKK